MRKRVVIVGSNATLLQIRQDVLEASGIPAETKLVQSVSPDLLASTEAELVIACSSLSPDGRQAIVGLLKREKPAALCLVVEPTSDMWKANPEPDAIVPGLDGPQKFVSTVLKMLAA